MKLTIVERPSPNHGARAGKRVDMLVLHYTGMKTLGAALDRLGDPRARVSAHYVVARDGRVFRLVDEKKRAWHAGVSFWAGERDVNSRSIGIELENPGHEFGYRAFPEKQIAALIRLARGIVERHAIPRRRVLGHSDVTPGRKRDPGEKFPWRRLAAAGIGFWPEPGRAAGAKSKPRAKTAADVAAAQRALAAFGYAIAATGRRDRQTRAVVRAFQRHYRPARADGRLDRETAALAAALTRSPRRPT
ncbi:MAG: N-acetylmuramoyl-L-alanine amidase [Rhodospirillales bacterium]